jgi:hypothetical protein
VAHPQIATFARLAEGSAKPIRAIAGQKTNFTRTIHDMDYDPVHDEIVVPQYYAFAIMTFRGDANGDVAPIRTIFGPETQLKNNDAVTVDGVHNEIFVPQGDRILVFPREGNGDVAPTRILEGADTGLRGGGGVGRVAVDPVHNLLIVAGSATGGGSRLAIFDRTASGNTKPLRVLAGKKSLIAGTSILTVYPAKGLIFATIRGGSRFSQGDFAGVWSINDDGDVPPMWRVGEGVLKDIRDVTIDPAHHSVIISDKALNAVLTFQTPEIL